MFKKRVKYTDFNDVEREQDFYFHLNKTELVTIGATNGTIDRMQLAVSSKDPIKILHEVEELVLIAYGVRTEDGEGFVKTAEEKARFQASPAYDELIMSLLTDENAALEFMRQLMPKEMQGKLDAEIAKLPSMEDLREQIAQKLENPFAEPTEVIPAKQIVEQTDDEELPAWFVEGRSPTKQELMRMSQRERQWAFRLKQSGELK